MSFARKEPRANTTEGLAFPKPVPRVREPKPLRPRQPAPGEPRKFSTFKPAKRWGIAPDLDKTIARRAARAGADPEYLAWVRKQPCKAREIPGHRCWGRLDPHHAGEGVAHPDPEKRKTCDRTAIPICRGGHRDIETLSGMFKDFDAESRRELCDRWIVECRVAFLIWKDSGPTDYPLVLDSGAAADEGNGGHEGAVSLHGKTKDAETVPGEPERRCTKPGCAIHPTGMRS